MTLSTYLKHREAHNRATYFYPEKVFLYKGEYFSHAEFNEKYPITGKIISNDKFIKGENPDKRHSFFD